MPLRHVRDAARPHIGPTHPVIIDSFTPLVPHLVIHLYTQRTRGRGQLRSDLAGRLWDYPSLCTHVAGDRHAHGVAPTSAAKKDALHLGE